MKGGEHDGLFDPNSIAHITSDGTTCFKDDTNFLGKLLNKTSFKKSDGTTVYTAIFKNPVTGIEITYTDIPSNYSFIKAFDCDASKYPTDIKYIEKGNKLCWKYNGEFVGKLYDKTFTNNAYEVMFQNPLTAEIRTFENIPSGTMIQTVGCGYAKYTKSLGRVLKKEIGSRCMVSKFFVLDIINFDKYKCPGCKLIFKMSSYIPNKEYYANQEFNSYHEPNCQYSNCFTPLITDTMITYYNIIYKTDITDFLKKQAYQTAKIKELKPILEAEFEEKRRELIQTATGGRKKKTRKYRKHKKYTRRKLIK